MLDHGRQAGLGTDTLPAATGLYLPLGDERQRLGVLAVLPVESRGACCCPNSGICWRPLPGRSASRWSARASLRWPRQPVWLPNGRRLRNTLLASISHDLRTPLAVMAGAGSTLAEHGAKLDEATRFSLAHSIEIKAREMSELVSNVLDLMRFESGQVILRRDWETLDDLVGTALQRLESQLAGHLVELRIPADLPPVYVDPALVVQMFANLFDNAAKYTPPGTRVWVSAAADGGVRARSGGGRRAGLAAPVIRHGCSTSFSAATARALSWASGLGLAICQAIVRAHGGEIEAHRRRGSRRPLRGHAARERA